jgi:hypothetical protein
MSSSVLINVSSTVKRGFSDLKQRKWKQLKYFTKKGSNWTHEELCEFFSMLQTTTCLSKRSLLNYAASIKVKFEEMFPPARFKEVYPKIIPFIRSMGIKSKIVFDQKSKTIDISNPQFDAVEIKEEPITSFDNCDPVESNEDIDISNPQFDAVEIKEEPITSFDNCDPVESNEDIVNDPICVNSNQMSSSLSEQSASSTTVKAKRKVTKVQVSKTYNAVRDKHWKELKEFTQKDTKWTHEELCEFFLMLKTKKGYSSSTLRVYVTTISFKFEDNFPPAKFKQVYPKLVPFIKSLKPVELKNRSPNDSEQVQPFTVPVNLYTEVVQIDSDPLQLDPVHTDTTSVQTDTAPVQLFKEVYNHPAAVQSYSAPMQPYKKVKRNTTAPVMLNQFCLIAPKVVVQTSKEVQSYSVKVVQPNKEAMSNKTVKLKKTRERQRQFNEVKDFTQKDTKWSFEELSSFFSMLKHDRNCSQEILRIYLMNLKFNIESTFSVIFSKEYPKLQQYVHSLN